MKDINLTVCLRFNSSPDRDVIQATDAKYRKLKLPSIAQSFINILLMARELQRAGVNDRGATGHVEVNGEIFTVTITPPGYSDPSVR